MDEYTPRTIDYEAIRESEPLKVGDRVRLNGQLYYISEITYEGGINTLPTIRYEMELMQPYYPFQESRFANIPYESHLSFRQLMTNERYLFEEEEKEEELSSETRQEFMKLLE